ncbi:MAG: dienelactone hydrolase family protein [Alphaproteobacteria bacterium]|nr:dienelactone hydrolase family protein [Alphaproteobacteria bacterium]
MAETKVEVKTADGTAEAFLFTPSSGSGPWPGVVYLTDIMGIRPAYHQMAQRLADQGYAVLLPNIFYRGTKLPVLDFVPQMGDERTMKRMGELRASLPNDKMGPDGAAYADFLLAQKMKGPKVGVVGYCFTGSMSVRTAAAAPDKIAAAASFHGGGLYTDQPDSPHLLLPKIKARLYFGHAVQDRSMPAETIAKFEAALKAWPGKSESETYEGALHGWCVPGRPEIYNQPQAERAFDKMVALFDAALK